MILGGDWECWALIDSDLNLNIICQSLMKKWRINFDWELKGHPFVINGEKLFDYGIHDFKMHIYDYDEQINTYCESFPAAELPGLDVILGYPWLYDVNSEIDWKTAFCIRYEHFEYLIMPFGFANVLVTF